MHHLDRKAVILDSYEDSLALHKALSHIMKPTMGHDTHITIFDETWFASNNFRPIIHFNYFANRLNWSWGSLLDSIYTYLPIEAILNPSDYPEYFI